MARWKTLALPMLAAAIWFAVNQVDVARDAIRVHLVLYGSSVYEARESQGAWPVRVSDLEGTTVARTMPLWKHLLAERAYVVIAPRDWPSDRAANAARILAYHATGLLSSLGRVFVLRGDLRVEWIPARELRQTLTRQGAEELR